MKVKHWPIVITTIVWLLIFSPIHLGGYGFLLFLAWFGFCYWWDFELRIENMPKDKKCNSCTKRIEPNHKWGNNPYCEHDRISYPEIAYSAVHKLQIDDDRDKRQFGLNLESSKVMLCAFNDNENCPEYSPRVTGWKPVDLIRELLKKIVKSG